MLISEPSTSILANSQLQCLKCIEITFHYFFFNIDIAQTPCNPQFFLSVEAGCYRPLCGDFHCNLCPMLMPTLSRGEILLRRVSTFTQMLFFSLVIFLFLNIKSSTAFEFQEATCTDIGNTGSFQPRKSVLFFYSLFYSLFLFLKTVWCPGRGPRKQRLG